MNTGCSHERLKWSLAGSLNADDEATLSRHLDECELCTAELERLAGGDCACHEIASSLRPDDLDDALPLREEGSTVDFVVEHLEPSDDPAVLGRLGGYDVFEIIGRGGMGVVLRGFDRELKRFVAIKALAPHLAHSALARKRFAREAQAAAAVVDLHVVSIHQVQPNGHLPFLVMPLLNGESLAQRLMARGSLELREILRIGMQAAQGLAAAHAQGLIHRDIKPANILLEKGVERAVLTDFGLARAADDVSMTRFGIIAGTPEYMSPEQARGETLDGRSDLFSLGCVLYEMATGVSPFRADSTLATLRRIVDERPAAMASLVPDLPPWFIAIVERLLAKDPAERFASASEVSKLLEQCLSHLQQPTLVSPPKPAALKSVRPRRPPVARWLIATAMAFTLILAGIMVVLELNKGRLTIQCAADDVPVRITQGSTVVKKLTVTKAGATLRIAAGKYVVEIDGPVDGIVVKDGAVSLKRGGVETVRIAIDASPSHQPREPSEQPPFDPFGKGASNSKYEEPVGSEIESRPALVGPGIEFELRVHGKEGKEVEITHVYGICVSDDGLVVLPISAKSLAEDSPMKAIALSGTATLAGADESHRLTLVKFKQQNVAFRYFKCRLALPVKGQRFSIYWQSPREAEVTAVGQDYEPPLQGDDGFLVEPLHGAPIGSPLLLGDEELQGILLQASASADRVANDNLRNVNVPAVHIQALIDAYWQANNKLPAAVTVPFAFDFAEVPWEAGRKLNADDKFAFGPVRDGLQLGVALPACPGRYRPSDELRYEVAIRNAGNERVRFVLWSPQQPTSIIDADGNRIPLVWYEPDFESLPTFISLAPGEARRTKYAVSLTREPKDSGALGPWWESPWPGSYKLTAGLSLDVLPSGDPGPQKATQIFVRSAGAPLLIAGLDEPQPAEPPHGVEENAKPEKREKFTFPYFLPGSRIVLGEELVDEVNAFASKEEQIQFLIRILPLPDQVEKLLSDRQVYAIRLLSLTDSNAVIGPLMDRFDVMHKGDGWPVVHAMARLGERSVEPLLERLQRVAADRQKVAACGAALIELKAKQFPMFIEELKRRNDLNVSDKVLNELLDQYRFAPDN